MTDLRLPSRIALSLLIIAASTVAAPSTAIAHTDLDFTLPTDGASLGEPLEEITVGFTQPVTLVGPGFEVLSPQGDIVQPFVVTDDDMVFRLQIDPPMGGGDVGVRYEVTAPDGHVISGGFAFTVSVEAPVPAVATTVATTVPPATTSPATTATTNPATSVTVEAAPTSVAPATTTPTIVDAPDEAELETVAAAEPATEQVAPVDTAPDDGGSTGIYIAIAAAIAIAAGAFLFFRRRSAA